jgi:hypothetical protein
MTDDDYIAAQNLTRLRIAYDILREIPPSDKSLTKILIELSRLKKEYYRKLGVE